MISIIVLIRILVQVLCSVLARLWITIEIILHEFFSPYYSWKIRLNVLKFRIIVVKVIRLSNICDGTCAPGRKIISVCSTLVRSIDKFMWLKSFSCRQRLINPVCLVVPWIRLVQLYWPSWKHLGSGNLFVCSLWGNILQLALKACVCVCGALGNLSECWRLCWESPVSTLANISMHVWIFLVIVFSPM